MKTITTFFLIGTFLFSCAKSRTCYCSKTAVGWLPQGYQNPEPYRRVNVKATTKRKAREVCKSLSNNSDYGSYTLVTDCTYEE